MLHQTIDLDADAREHGNALRAASRYGYGNIVRILLNAGANVNAKGWDNGSALQQASVCGQEEVVRILLDAGADVNADEGPNGNALEAATCRGSEVICQLILDAGASLDTRSSALHDALWHLSRLEMLLEAGVDVDRRGRYASTPLQTAVFYGLDATVQTLIAAGADVNASDGQWRSAFATACQEGHSTIMQMLLNAEARLQELEHQQIDSSLYNAAKNGHEDAVKVLLDAGVDVEAQGERYGYALQAASAYNHETVVRMLLHAGANVNAQGKYFGNALQAAASDSEPTVGISGKPTKRMRYEKKMCSDDRLLIFLRSPEVTFELLVHPTDTDKGQKVCYGIILEEMPEHIDKNIL